jgi:hypothetical protein
MAEKAGEEFDFTRMKLLARYLSSYLTNPLNLPLKRIKEVGVVSAVTSWHCMAKCMRHRQSYT